MLAQGKRGFTVVELLVVVAIIGVLVALLLPAIQAAREAARRANCESNLRQCGSAISEYVTSKDQFPASRTAHTLGATSVIMNWVYPVLTNLGETSLHRQLRTGTLPSPLPKLPVLICPSQAIFGQPDAPLSYAVNGGRANNANNLDYNANGVFVDKAVANPQIKDMRIVDLTDGQSNTLMLLENLSVQGWLLAPYEQYAAVLWYPEGYENNAPFPGSLNQNRLIGKTELDAEPKYGRPASAHPNGFLVVMCDNSVHWMSENISYGVYAVLMTSDGAKAADPAQPLSSQTLPNPIWQQPHNQPLPTPPYPGTEF
jgi:prepilin-type N-terminal cleavage/methylation domain-containing protein